MKLRKTGEAKYVYDKEGNMNTDAVFFLNDKLLGLVEDKAVEQAKNVACLPGIKGQSIAMSDMHMGYGFPIGGVAAFDKEEGCITPGGIGFDINCGVRLLKTNLKYDDIKDDVRKLVLKLFEKIPCGVGRGSDLNLSMDDMDEVLVQGSSWALSQGFGVEDDLKFCESGGEMKGADPDNVSHKAKARGKKQLGTLGAGNHFLEIQEVMETDNKFGLEKGQIVLMIHCGSRGLGHQVCSDYLRRMEDAFPELIKALPEKDLVYAPISSDIAKEYYSAMKAAANFAWANRHVIASKVREAVCELYPEAKLDLVYDVAHNIAKLEEHTLDGEKEEVYVHRKGATRAFPPGHPELPEDYRETGQPVLLPGSMGTASYVLVGTEKAMQECFGSSAHGAGRVMSRAKAKREFKADSVR
ncbi:MAG: RtcB family protein, partial [Nanobdellota archaeon]